MWLVNVPGPERENCHRLHGIAKCVTLAPLAGLWMSLELDTQKALSHEPSVSPGSGGGHVLHTQQSQQLVLLPGTQAGGCDLMPPSLQE